MTDTASIAPSLTRRGSRVRRAILATTALALSGAVLSPAHAETDRADDPVGDASSAPNTRAMDVSSVTVRNRDRSVLVITRFANRAKGTLIVSIDPRGGEGVRMISEHTKRPVDDDVVARYAFTDQGIGSESSPGPVECPGYKVTWAEDDRSVRMVLPSTCLEGGDYGAIRYSVLTEVGGGGDSDEAHVGRQANRDWVGRG